ncbi:DDE-type integrase/transposase/recombinase [bacterium]|nr:DDE-type integrase/transposase/recombinase [bacterium]
MHDDEDRRLGWALTRYRVISAYLALDPPRGQREATRKQIAAKTWTGPDGESFTVVPETIRTWVRRYRRHGFDGLKDKPRPRRGVQILDGEQIELVCRLKKEVPERSLDRIITIAEDTELVKPGLLRRSTVHRVLRAHGLSKRHTRIPDTQDLDRFEADFPNDLWQSDMLVGPWMPDPERPGKVRRANLFAFLDDHSRLLLHGRFSFRENLPRLELVFRRALQKYGVARRVYYDNGQVYRSGHMKQIVATLGIHRVVFTRAHRPMGHGKIEALNRLIRSAFIAELKASKLTSLDALNEAFVAWSDYEYNRSTHSETGEAPRDRWRAGIERIRYADEEKLRQAFLWKENRTPDKTGVFSLLGVRYQAGTEVARRRVEVRFDPEAMQEVEVWHGGAFIERVQPLDVTAHRRPRTKDDENPAPETPAEPVADWLGHLVERRRQEGFTEPSPRQHVHEARHERERADAAVLDVLREHLDDGVVDPDIVKSWLDRYGPVDADTVARTLERLIAHDQHADQHVVYYLDAIRAERNGGTP